MVIFRAIEAPSGEDLSVPAEGRGFSHQIETNATPPTVYRTLEASQMQLGAVASRLRSSGTWKVLAHAGWVQGATDWPKHVGIPLEQLGINVPGCQEACSWNADNSCIWALICTWGRIRAGR